MKKVAITGHTQGLGKALFERFAVDYKVAGFSRSNGYDIRKIEPIIGFVRNYDIFINNACDRFSQVDLLYTLYSGWQDQDKVIVNISSLAPDGFKEYPQPYASHKAALDNASRQLSAQMKRCKVINIKPGYIRDFDTLADTIHTIVNIKSPIAEVKIANG